MVTTSGTGGIDGFWKLISWLKEVEQSSDEYKHRTNEVVKRLVQMIRERKLEWEKLHGFVSEIEKKTAGDQRLRQDVLIGNELLSRVAALL
jgi:hypothetical protein